MKNAKNTMICAKLPSQMPDETPGNPNHKHGLTVVQVTNSPTKTSITSTAQPSKKDKISINKLGKKNRKEIENSQKKNLSTTIFNNEARNKKNVIG